MTYPLLQEIARRDEQIEGLRTRLAESDQQIEWLSKENAALRGHAAEVTAGLRELRSLTREALDAMIQHNTSLRSGLEQSERNNEYLRSRVSFLEKVLNSKPGTMYYGQDGFFVRGSEQR